MDNATNDLVLNDTNIHILPSHQEVLPRGISFIPSSTFRLNPDKDLDRFKRNLNLRCFWANKQVTTHSSLNSAVLKSNWEPPQVFHQFNQSWRDFELAANAVVESDRSNLPTRLRYAWRDLTTNPNFYIIKADKGGRLVM